MKEYAPGDLRNFALVGHATCGKTMLAECMLACSGAIGRLGSVAAGTTVSDYHESEQKRQISIQTSLLHTEWLGRKLNILDTPGYQDFASEALVALRVSDFAVLVVHAVDGVGLGTTQMAEYIAAFQLPKIIVVNMTDKEHADFDAVLADLKERFGSKVIPLALPVDPGPGFHRVLDVMRTELITYAPDASGKYGEAPAEGEWAEKARALHQELIEHTAEADDQLMEKFFEQGGLTEEQLRAGVHAAFQKGEIIPVFCTSAERNVGVARLLDFIAKYGSSPWTGPRSPGPTPTASRWR